jgi:hypothetical protein
MIKTKLMRLTVLLSIIVLVSTTIAIKPTSALISQNNKSWFWANDTNVAAIAAGDINGDNLMEIVTAGWFNDGLRWEAQLAVWSATNFALLNVTSWYWTSSTQINSVALGDVNGDGIIEIVAGGSYYNGTNWFAQFSVWSGRTLANLGVQAWLTYNRTQVSSVAVANITGTTGLSIITGGSYTNGNITVAQLCVWNGASLALQNVTAWAWGNKTYVNSVAVADINGTNIKSVVTGGAYFDGTRNVAQLVEWNASNLAVQSFTGWFWTGDTEINTVAIGNVTGGSALEIVTGGSYFDGTRSISQLVKWNGASLALLSSTAWFWTSNTTINSVAIGNYTGGNSMDIITAGSFHDGSRLNGQLVDWNGTSLAYNSFAYWFQTSDTTANSVVIANAGIGNRVYSGGSFFDATRANAQLTSWG